MIAPPTIAVQSIPDPCPYVYQAINSKCKNIRNIIELNNPTASILHIANCPKVNIETTTTMQLQTASIASVLPGFCLPRLNAAKFTATNPRNVRVLLTPESEKVQRFRYSLVT